jgi:competence protein ComEC
MAALRATAPPPITYCPLVLLAAALAAGIAADRAWAMGVVAWWAIATGSLVLWLVLWLGRRERLASWLLLASCLATGGLWHHSYWRLYAADDIGRIVREEAGPICVEGVALTSPRWVPAPPPTPLRTIPQGERSELLVALTAVRDGARFRATSGWAALTVGGLLHDVRAGDKLRVMAHGNRPNAPLNPGEFDFASYARSERTGCRLFAGFPQSVELLRRGSRWSLRRWLADAREGGSALLWRYIAPRRATLASAVLLGTREQLDPDRNEDYLVTGTIHVLSISGLHVGILAAFFFFVLRLGLVPRQWTLAATITLTIAYALLTDLEPPVVRAAVLVVLSCVGMWSGRSAIGFNSLAAAAIVVLAMNPASLFLAGPQLSFLAVATMIACQSALVPQPIVDPLDRLIANTRPWTVRLGRYVGGMAWRVWLAGALIWLVATPLVWKQYHLVSPVALVLNFLMWIPVSLAMYSGLGTLVFGGYLPLAGRVLGQTCDRSLELLEGSIAAGSQWPGNHFWYAAPPGWWIGLFYASLAIAVVFPALRPRRQWLWIGAIAWLAGALFLSGREVADLLPLGNRPLVCHFVAVGHGVSVLVELPDGKTLLYDSGRLGSPVTGVRSISSVLWSRGITHLDAVFVSHADADHFNAIPGLVERFSVGAVYVSPVMFDSLPPAVKELRDAIERKNIPLREIHGGQHLAVAADVNLEVLHPSRKGVYGSDNANSLVLLLEYAGRRILLTGDLESPGLDDVLAERPLDCDLVLAPHHGSPRSSPGRFAEWSTPEYVVISGRQSLGDAATIESVKNSFRLHGAEVFHTAEDGCVRVEISRQELAVASFRPHVRASSSNLASTKLLEVP